MKYAERYGRDYLERTIETVRNFPDAEVACDALMQHEQGILDERNGRV